MKQKRRRRIFKDFSTPLHSAQNDKAQLYKLEVIGTRGLFFCHGKKKKWLPENWIEFKKTAKKINLEL